MLLRFSALRSSEARSHVFALSCARRYTALQLSNDQREALSKSFAAAREEAKGQALDLADMAAAARQAAKNIQDAVGKVSVKDDKFTGKSVTINASLKAYNTRLTNLQNEVRAIQSEIDAMLKLVWATSEQTTARPSGTNSQSPLSESITKTPPSEAEKPSAEQGDFACDAPPAPTPLSTPSPPKPSVEVVEGELVKGSSSQKATKAEPTVSEIEVEPIEVEPAPDSTKASSESARATAHVAATPGSSEHNDKANPGSTDAQPTATSKADTMSITEITKDLYERGVEFADCLDSRSLRQRYRDVLEGKITARKAAPSSTTSSSTSPRSSSFDPSKQPPPPPRSQYQQQQQHYQPPPPNTEEKGLAQDPYPGASRRMVDPSKFVWEMKAEIAKEKNMDPSVIDLWSGYIRLEDHKRLYDYPSIQNAPLECRYKGDRPR